MEKCNFTAVPNLKKHWRIFIWSKNLSLQQLHCPEMTGAFWGLLQISDRIRYVLSWNTEPKIRVCLSYSLPLAVLLAPTLRPLYLSGGHREAVVGAVMKCWQPRYLFNLPFPRKERDVFHSATWHAPKDNQTQALDRSGVGDCCECCCLLHPLVSCQPCTCIVTLLTAPGPFPKQIPSPAS